MHCRLVCRDHLVARHRRHWGKEHVTFDPVHYLALLERKPGAFDFARPLVGWDLPADFAVLRRRFEAAWGEAGVRHFIQVLRLLEKCSLDELTAAVERALAIGATTADAVRVLLEVTREAPVALFRLDGRPHLAGVTVPRPDLTAYHALREPSPTPTLEVVQSKLFLQSAGSPAPPASGSSTAAPSPFRLPHPRGRGYDGQQAPAGLPPMPDPTNPPSVPDDPAATTGPTPSRPTPSGPRRSTPAPVPGYEVLGEVGRGGMGIVYRAHDPAVNRDVAVKVLQDRFRDSPAAIARFVEEGQITGQLQHPGIPAVHQIGTLPDGSPFLAMKLIRGDTLADRLAAPVRGPRRDSSPRSSRSRRRSGTPTARG